MNSIATRLQNAGIYAHGTPQLKRYEGHIARYFIREYARLKSQPSVQNIKSVITDQGPMWKNTGSLIEHHYNSEATPFRYFLDDEFNAYTMAYYGEDPESIAASKRSLEDAEREKFRLACERADISGHEKIFNIGCGYGPLETYLFQAYPGVEITSITPSKDQIEFIKSCMSNPNHPISCGELRLIDGDFGKVPIDVLGGSVYDAVFAIGCFEHVNNLEAAFQAVAKLLKPGGRFFLHLVVSRIVIPQFLDDQDTMIGSYFPGGKIWPFDVIKDQNKLLELENSWFINGMNYWRTIDEWHKRLWQNMDRIFGSVISDQQEAKYWNDYFILCKSCFVPFKGELFGNGHFLFRKGK